MAKRNLINFSGIDIFNKFVTTFKNIGWVIAIFFPVGGIVSATLTRLSQIDRFLSKHLPPSIYSAILWIASHWKEFTLGLLFFLLIKLLLLYRKEKRNNLTLFERFAKDLHTEFIHEVRTQIVQLGKVAQQVASLNIDEENGKTRFDALLTEEFSKLQKNIQPYVNMVSKYLSDLRRNKVSVCIKIFAFEADDTKMEDRHLITIARCGNTDSRRKRQRDNPIVGKNTDFLELCRGTRNYYGSSDLHKKSDNGDYESDSKFFKPEFYTSTLVAPIRCTTPSISNSNLSIMPNVIGFLCLDSKEKVLEWENADSLDLQVIALFADALYVYLHHFYMSFNFKLYKE